MKKIIVSLTMLAALSTASFAAQRGQDPEETVTGRTLSVLTEKNWADANSAASAFAVEPSAYNGNSAIERLEMNADQYQYIR